VKLNRIVVFVCVLLVSTVCSSQTSPDIENGFKSYGSYEGGKIDTVNVLNGNLMLTIPLPFAFPQRGALQRDYKVYLTSKNWTVQCVSSTQSSNGLDCQWTPAIEANCIQQFSPVGNHQAEVCPVVYGAGLSSSFDFVVKRTFENDFVPGNIIYDAFGYSLVTWDLAVHQLTTVPSRPSSPVVRTLMTTDGTGYRVELSGPDAHGIPQNVTVIDRMGNQFLGTFPSSDQIQTGFRDPFDGVPPVVVNNGTYMPLADGSGGGSNSDYFSGQLATFATAIDANGNTYDIANGLDTLNRHAPASGGTADSGDCVSPLPIARTTPFTYQGPDGAAHTVTFCYSSFPISTSFGQSGISEAGSTTANPGLTATPRLLLLATIVLPDRTKWTFNYDTYGEVTSVGLPGGGSLSYNWTTIGFGCDFNTPVSRAVFSRTTNDNNGNSLTTNYHWRSAATNTQLTNTVTDGAGNDAEHVFTLLAAPCDYYETTTRYYQGTGSGRAQLKQTDTSYSSANIGDDTSSGSLANVFATDITTTVYPSVKKNTIHRVSDPGLGPSTPIFGNVAQEYVYNWGNQAPGGLLRETATVFQWQKKQQLCMVESG